MLKHIQAACLAPSKSSRSVHASAAAAQPSQWAKHSESKVDWSAEERLQREMQKRIALQKVLLRRAQTLQRAKMELEQIREFAYPASQGPLSEAGHADTDADTWILDRSCLRTTEHTSDMVGHHAFRRTMCDAVGTDMKVLPKHDVVVVKQPANGCCLFHSLSYGISERKSARSLKREICEFILHNGDLEIAGMSLKDWVLLESGKCVRDYVRALERGGWGGAIEIEVFVHLFCTGVEVFEACRGGYKRICCFDCDGQCPGYIKILYQNGEHYDALLPAPTKSTTGEAFSRCASL